jgi:hypothetical protein
LYYFTKGNANFWEHNDIHTKRDLGDPIRKVGAEFVGAVFPAVVSGLSGADTGQVTFS